MCGPWRIASIVNHEEKECGNTGASSKFSLSLTNWEFLGKGSALQIALTKSLFAPHFEGTEIQV